MKVAGRFFDGLTSVAHEVDVLLEGGALRVVGADGVELAAWPAASVCRSDGHLTDGSVTLRRRGGAERLHVSDLALLATLQDAGAKLGGGAVWTGRRWAGLAAGFVAAIGIAALLVDRLPGILAPFVPHRLERAWSEEAEGVVSVNTSVCTGAAGTAALARLFGRLAAGAGLPAAPDFEVLDARVVNAFTLPDGRVIVLRGLIDEAQDSDELAGVLAHELGHVRHHDPTREMLRRLALDMVARSMGWGGGVASAMATLSYGRRAEARADASAITTLHAAGLRADGLSRFFVLLQSRMVEDGVPAFLSDHPTTSDRAARLRQPAVGAHALSDAEWQGVRGMCGA